MAANGKTKTKILYLWKILQEETDAEHGLTMAAILERLSEYGISAERKSIYADINTLKDFDVDIRTLARKPVEYALVRHDFTLEELTLLVDVIQSCRAITDHQAAMLTTNVKQLASTKEQAVLDRRIHVAGRIESKTDSVLSTVDAIHDALRARCKMEFVYLKVGLDGRPANVREGKKHLVTPVGIAYEDGFYYLSAWSERHSDIAEYRLDRMASVYVLEQEPATRNDAIANHRFDAGRAAKFGRFRGEEVLVTLAAQPGKAGIITDRFGKAATFLTPDALEARALVRVCKSEQFFGWVASMGKAIRIIAPESLVEEYRAYLRYLLED